MPKWIKRMLFIVLIIAIIIVLGVGYLYVFHSYHGPTYTTKPQEDTADKAGMRFSRNTDLNQNGVSNQNEIVKAARSLVGTLYDPLKGGEHNIGGRLGFIVCIDVPRIAYGKAGISFYQLLSDDYKKHPEHYDTQKGINTPETPYFFRRVRNVYDYTSGNNQLIKKAKTPRVGDIVFYSRYHATLVVGVHNDGTYDEVEAHPDLITVKEHKHKKWTPRDVARILK